MFSVNLLTPDMVGYSWWSSFNHFDIWSLGKLQSSEQTNPGEILWTSWQSDILQYHFSLFYMMSTILHTSSPHLSHADGVKTNHTLNQASQYKSGSGPELDNYPIDHDTNLFSSQHSKHQASSWIKITKAMYSRHKIWKLAKILESSEITTSNPNRFRQNRCYSNLNMFYAFIFISWILF